MLEWIHSLLRDGKFFKELERFTEFAAKDGHAKKPKTVLDTPELRELLGEWVWFCLKYVRIHTLGLNLERDLAPRLVNSEHCTKGLAETQTRGGVDTSTPFIVFLVIRITFCQPLS